MCERVVFGEFDLICHISLNIYTVEWNLKIFIA